MIDTEIQEKLETVLKRYGVKQFTCSLMDFTKTLIITVDVGWGDKQLRQLLFDALPDGWRFEISEFAYPPQWTTTPPPPFDKGTFTGVGPGPVKWTPDQPQAQFFPEMVSHPPHYNAGKIEVIEFIEDQNLNFCRGNVVKYLSRAGKKDASKEIEDLKKASWYLQREIECVEAKEKGREKVRPNDMVQK